MTISVVVVTYRRPQLLAQSLRSLRNQTRVPDEIVVVYETDDPESGNVAKKELGDTGLLLLVESSKHCIIAAENAALAQARGEVVCFLDDDAEAFPDWLERIEGRYLEDETLGAVGGQDVIHREGQPIPESCQLTSMVGRWTWYGRSYGNHHKVASTPLYVDCLKGCNMSVRRLPGLLIDNRLSHSGTTGPHWEEDLCWHISKRGKRILFDPEIRVKHFVAPRLGGSREELEMSRKALHAANFNCALVRLKHLWSWQKAAFLVYTFLIGDLESVGLLQTIRQSYRTRSTGWWRVWWWSTIAKSRAVKVWCWGLLGR